MYVTLLSSTCFGPWHAHPQEEQLHEHSIWYPRSSKRLYTTPVESGLSTGVVYSHLEERGYQMLCLCSCSSWGWACQGPKHVEDSNVTYMFILKCALKLFEEIILIKITVKIIHCWIKIPLTKFVPSHFTNWAIQTCNNKNKYLKKVNPLQNIRHWQCGIFCREL